MRSGAWVGIVAVVVIGGVAAGWVALGEPAPKEIPAALGLAAPSAEEGARKDPALAVKVAEAVRDDVPISFEYTGTIISPKDAKLQARVTGIVIDRPFEPGSEVKENQLLFQIDKRPFEIALKSAEAQKTQAQASLAFASAQVTRASALKKKGFETEQRSQQLDSQKATASSNLQQADASIQREKLNIDYSTITAPFDGRVSLSQINVGDTVIKDQTELATVVQVDPIDLQVALSADDAEAVREALEKGQANVALLNSSGKPDRKAQVYKLDNRFDPRTARRLVRALVHNADGRYLPGQFVRARIEVGTQSRVLVPTIALATQLDQQILYAVGADDKIKVLAVKTGKAYGDKTAILDGVKPGTKIAIDHLQRLDQGVAVKPETAETASSE